MGGSKSLTDFTFYWMNLVDLNLSSPLLSLTLGLSKGGEHNSQYNSELGKRPLKADFQNSPWSSRILQTTPILVYNICRLCLS